MGVGLYLIYIVYPIPVRLIQCYLGWGGDNHTPPLPLYVYNTIHSQPPPSQFIYHAITFSYTYSTYSITNSYSMVVCGGVRNVIAWQIRSYINCNDIVILRVYYIPLPSNRVSIAFY